MIDEQEEIRRLRDWRHNLEGMGIQSIPERVKELERTAQREAIDSTRLEATISTLKQGFDSLRNSIDGFHVELKETRDSFAREVGGVKRWAIVAVIAISLSSLMPEAVITQLINLLFTAMN